jgi:hypothetical protein
MCRKFANPSKVQIRPRAKRRVLLVCWYFLPRFRRVFRACLCHHKHSLRRMRTLRLHENACPRLLAPSSPCEGTSNTPRNVQSVLQVSEREAPMIQAPLSPKAAKTATTSIAAIPTLDLVRHPRSRRCHRLPSPLLTAMVAMAGPIPRPMPSGRELLHPPAPRRYARQSWSNATRTMKKNNVSCGGCCPENSLGSPSFPHRLILPPLFFQVQGQREILVSVAVAKKENHEPNSRTLTLSERSSTLVWS